MSFALKTLTVVQGATLTRTLQGTNLDGTVPTTFLNTDTLTSTIWLAQSEASVATPTVAWFAAASCQFTVTISATQSALLTIDTVYNLQVFATRSGVPYCIGWLYLQVIPAAGSQAAAIPADLITGAYAAQMLMRLSLDSSQLEMIPTLITSASTAVRRWCNDRDFTQQTYTKEFPVGQGSVVRLAQMPVNQVFRVQAVPQVSLTISNTSTSVQTAQAYFAVTGDYTAGQTVTGITLNWTSNGTLTTTTVTYTANETISALATAINAVGSGWSALVTTGATSQGYGSWPVTELTGGYQGQGCLQGQGAQFYCYSTDLSDYHFLADDGRATGMLCCSYSGGSVNSPRWGPDWAAWSDGGFDNQLEGRVKVTYNAGFAIIPGPVQLATAELVIAGLQRLGTDFTLKSEKAKDYSYELAPMIKGMPAHVQEGLSQYRIANA